MKQGGSAARGVGVVCPAVLGRDEREAVIEMARRVFEVMHCPDLGRVDIRLHEDGTPYFIELNPLPSLHPDRVADDRRAARGLEYRDVLRLVVRSAARRYNLAVRPPRKTQPRGDHARPTAPRARDPRRTLRTGLNNAITDVKGVRVGHVTRIEDDVAGSRHQRDDHGPDRGHSDRAGRRRRLPAASGRRRICAQRGRRDGRTDPGAGVGIHRDPDSAHELAFGRAGAATA